MHVKICGITSKQDALHAVSAGATHIGMIFVEGSPRSINEIQTAREIGQAVGENAYMVGVFQNQTAETIAQIAVHAKIDLVQLHGNEDPAFCRSIGLRLGKPVIKSIVIAGGINNIEVVAKGDEQDIVVSPYDELKQLVASYGRDVAAYLLFDRAKGNKDENWLPQAIECIAKLERDLKAPEYNLPPYFFAGGLTDKNVSETLAQLHAAGVDVASGVERSPGQKDPALVEAFIKAAKGGSDKSRTGK